MYNNLWRWVTRHWKFALTIFFYIIGFFGMSVVEAKRTCLGKYSNASDEKLLNVVTAAVWPISVVVIGTEALMETANPKLKETCAP